MARALLLAFTSPASPEQDGSYNDWYNDVHVPDLLKVPGIVAARRYKLSERVLIEGAPEAANNYLAIYEIEGDIDQARAEMSKRAGTDEMRISPSLGTGGTVAQFWMPIEP